MLFLIAGRPAAPLFGVQAQELRGWQASHLKYLVADELPIVVPAFIGHVSLRNHVTLSFVPLSLA